MTKCIYEDTEIAQNNIINFSTQKGNFKTVVKKPWLTTNHQATQEFSHGHFWPPYGQFYPPHRKFLSPHGQKWLWENSYVVYWFVISQGFSTAASKEQFKYTNELWKTIPLVSYTIFMDREKRDIWNTS